MNNCVRRLLLGNTKILYQYNVISRQLNISSSKILCCSCYKYDSSPRYLYSKVSGYNLLDQKQMLSSIVIYRNFGTNKKPIENKKSDDTNQEGEQKLGLFKRFKQMYRDYWYVLIPVHCFTSAFWVAGLYYLATSGVDVIAILENIGASERILDLLKNNTSTGYFALTYALYKIATPARYAVTLGGTTLSINYLKHWGYIKPMPTKERLKEMYEEKRENFKDNIREKTGSFFKSKHK